MATTKKNSQKAKRKPGLLSKIKALVPGKKASPGRAYKDALENKKSTRLPLIKSKDPAHQPGHRRLSLKDKMPDQQTFMADDATASKVVRKDRLAQNKTNQRRVITGAAIGKSGRQS